MPSGSPVSEPNAIFAFSQWADIEKIPPPQGRPDVPFTTHHRTSGLGLLAATSLSSTTKADDGVIGDIIEGTEEFGLAIEAYTFGYPLVTMEMTRRVITNVAKPEGTKGPDGSDSSSCANIRTRRSATSPRPMPIRSTRRPSSTSARSPGSSAFRT